ncbi:hypothetical protein EGW08_006601 [Elysia chlorotica]|uniref:Uncharacterized protein n=1 Tax=Elysia chlorotica TaxID=188477 RepID=A0A3S1BDA5_ELYCH|nr:hypothetical protein EGW08_006601 [Elysia chlorotica]
MASSARYDQLVRLMLVGDQTVGKTCLLCQYANHEFHVHHVTTLGVDFRVRLIEVDGRTIKMQIWDTAGQERFLAITKQYYTRAQGCLLVFDICSRSSFESLAKWLLYVKMYAQKDTAVIIVGNKTDLEERRQVATETAQQFADENGILYYETSAKDLKSLEKPFYELCRQVVEATNKSLNAETNDTVRLEQENNTSVPDTATVTKSKCC